MRQSLNKLFVLLSGAIIILLLSPEIRVNGVVRAQSPASDHTLYLPLIRACAGFVNVKEFGAKGNGTAEDQAAFEKAFDTLSTVFCGGTLFVPQGTYLLARSKLTYYFSGTINVFNASNIEIVGEGWERTVLKLKPDLDVPSNSDTHVLRFINASHITIRDLVIDGSRSSYLSHDEQMHGLYLLNTRHVLVERVKFHQLRGDGVYVIGAQELRYCPNPPCYSEQVTIRDSWFYDNGRSGIANQGGVRYLSYSNNVFEHTSDQDIDFEPTGNRPDPTDIVIHGNIFNHSTLPYALTTSKAKRIRISNNVIVGGTVQMTDNEDLDFSHNVVINTRSSRVPLLVRRYQHNLQITNNYLESGQAGRVIDLGQFPNVSQVLIAGNDLVQRSAEGRGIYTEGLGNDITIVNNTLSGPENGSNAAAIGIRNQVDDGITRFYYTIGGNQLTNFATGVGFSTYNANTKFSDVTIADNTQYDEQLTTTQPMTITFSAGIGDSNEIVDNLHMEGNIIAPPPADVEIFVRPSPYEPGWANITVFNWILTDTVTVNVADVGFAAGDRYELRNVQDYFNDVTVGTYDGSGQITIPLPGTPPAAISAFVLRNQ